MLNLSIMETKVEFLPMVLHFFLIYEEVLILPSHTAKRMPRDGQTLYHCHSGPGDEDDNDDGDKNKTESVWVSIVPFHTDTITHYLISVRIEPQEEKLANPRSRR